MSKLSQGLFYITALAIMKVSQDNGKKTIKNDCQSAILNFIFVKFVMGYPGTSPYMLFYMHGSGRSRGGDKAGPPPIFVIYFKKSP